MQLDLAGVPARLERPMVAQYLVYDGEHVAGALAVVGGRVPGQRATPATSDHVHAVHAVLALPASEQIRWFFFSFFFLEGMGCCGGLMWGVPWAGVVLAFLLFARCDLNSLVAFDLAIFMIVIFLELAIQLNSCRLWQGINFRLKNDLFRDFTWKILISEYLENFNLLPHC